jgi:hypothetical protein
VLMYKLERVLESMDINNYNIKRVGYLWATQQDSKYNQLQTKF